MVDGKRFYFDNDFADFYNDNAIFEAYGGDEEEYAMLRLRLKDGLRDDLYYSRYKKHIPDDYIQRGKKLEKAGLVSVSDNVVSLTTRGFLLSNSVTARLLWG